MKKIKFSILTVTLNAEKEISQTIESILGQTYANFEVIVKDGLSKDMTCELIPKDSRIKLIKKSDHSVYEGMNQAIEYATGDYIIFMNAGDEFYNSHVLEKISDFIEKNGIQETTVLYGAYENKGNINFQKKTLKQIDFYRKPICHQSIIYPRNVFEYNGKFDLNYKICADHEMTVKLWCKGIPFRHTGFVICKYLGGGLSETDQNMRIAKKEKIKIVDTYFSGLKHQLLSFIVFIFVPQFKQLKNKLLNK